MSTTTEYQGESLSFFQLFIEKQLKIEVPIIQRDYAQGRSREIEVRNNFLDALLKYLEEGKPGRELDFVYGAISKTNNGENFIPLDGQQRLTTLLLLHWYLSLIADKIADFRQTLVDEHSKSKFTYETRSSTSEFCTCLLTKDLPYKEYQPSQKISDIICNEGWYFKAWDYDPSISSMLEMLNAIEEKFHQHPQFYQHLISLQEPIITFQFLNLKHFGLTDDLYIKMNSRGKPLNPFENFKAKLEQKIATVFAGTGITFLLQTEGVKVVKNPSEYFSHQIDTNWLNYFWQAGGKNAKLVDGQLMNFIRIVLSNHYALSGSNYTGENARILFKTQDAIYAPHDKDNLSYFSYESLSSLLPKSLENLIRSFDRLSLINKIAPELLPDSFHYEHSAIIKNVISHNLTAGNRILFHAFIGHLILHEANAEGLNDWMRVVFNLVENTRLEDAGDITNALKAVEEMLPYSKSILSALANQNIPIIFFYSRQVEEEKVKACLILKSRWAEKIYQTEKHNILRGQIGFILEFSEILAYYSANGNCSWSNADDEEYFNSFCDYVDKAIAALDYLRNRKDSQFLWERAVLTKGDYLLPSSYYRYHFLTTTGLTDRDNSWKRLLRLNREIDNLAVWDRKRKYVKDVFDDTRFDAKDVRSSCVEIIKDQVPDWRQYFVRRPELISYCLSGFIRRENDLRIYLLETTKLTYHYELRTINLYLESINNKNWTPLKETRYEKEYGNDGHSHIHVGEFSYNSKGYEIKIYFEEVSRYSLRLKKKYALTDPEGFDESIIALCDRHGLKLIDWRGYFLISDSQSGIVQTLIALIEDLRRVL
jgi:hypothetical protein